MADMEFVAGGDTAGNLQYNTQPNEPGRMGGGPVEMVDDSDTFKHGSCGPTSESGQKPGSGDVEFPDGSVI